jgi:spore germination cell wall hydrolase CwlJ-like protein
MTALDFAFAVRRRQSRARTRVDFMGAAALIALEMFVPRPNERSSASPNSPADLLIAAALFAGAAAAAIAQPPARAAAIAVPVTSRVIASVQTGPAGVKPLGPPVVAAAQAINAAMPFADGASQPARPFIMSGGAEDQARAMLCLTQAIYYEAGFEPLEGRRAVAQVVLNRVRHPAFPNSVCAVVYEAAPGGTCQFSFVCNGDIDRRPAPAAWAEAAAIAREALSGHVEASVGEATHYHADYIAPRWAPMLAKIAVIGHHIFYRWPGAWGEQAAFTQHYGGEPRDASAAHARLTLARGEARPAGSSPADVARAGRFSIPALLDRPGASPDAASAGPRVPQGQVARAGT